MTKTPSRHGTRWTDDERSSLRKLADGDTPTRLIAMKLGRTPDAVQQKASEEGISLRPTNQSPYNRRPR